MSSSSEFSDTSGAESPVAFVARTPNLGSNSEDSTSEISEAEVGGDADIEWEDVKQFKKRFVKWDSTYTPLSARFPRRRRGRRTRRYLKMPEDATNYDRPDLYASDVLNYMGLYMAKGRVGKDVDPIRGVELKPHEKLVMFQVDGVDPSVTDHEIFDKWQNAFLKRNNLPTALSFTDNENAEIYQVDYAAPIGDEWNIHQNPLFSQWVGGDQFLGRVWISPTPPMAKSLTQFPSNQNEWVKDLSFRTFLRVNPTGVRGNPPKFLKQTDGDDPSLRPQD